MPDMQYLLDNHSVSDIRKMCASFRALTPKEGVHQSCASLLRVPQLDALNHAR